MKRSRSLVLTLMAGTGLGLAGCDEAPERPSEMASRDLAASDLAARDLAARDLAGDERLYQTVEDCIAGKVFTVEHCEASYQAAQEAHAEVAPRFDNAAACEGEFGEGACTQQKASDGQSWFMPFLAGYAVSSLIDNIGDGFKRRRYGGYYAKPLYYSRRAGYVTASGHTLSNTAAARWSAPRSAPSSTLAPASSPTTTRPTTTRPAATAPAPTSTPRYGSTSQTRTTLTNRGGFSGGGAFRSFGG